MPAEEVSLSRASLLRLARSTRGCRARADRHAERLEEGVGVPCVCVVSQHEEPTATLHERFDPADRVRVRLSLRIRDDDHVTVAEGPIEGVLGTRHVAETLVPHEERLQALAGVCREARPCRGQRELRVLLFETDLDVVATRIRERIPPAVELCVAVHGCRDREQGADHERRHDVACATAATRQARTAPQGRGRTGEVPTRLRTVCSCGSAIRHRRAPVQVCRA